MSITRLAIRQAVAKRTRLGVLLTGTADGADTTHFQDGTIRAIGADSVILQAGAPFVITSDHTGGPAAGEDSRLSTTAITTGGIITLAPALTLAPDSGQTAEVWHKLLEHVDHVDAAIDRALTERCSYWGLTPLTILTDGDMEGSGVSDWTASTATPTKVALAFPNTWGNQHLRVTNSGANGYVYQAVACTEEDYYQLHIVMRAQTGTAEFSVYDVTNAAAVTLETLTGDSAASSTLGGWVIMRHRFKVPSGCKQFQVRIGADGAADVGDYAAVLLWREDDKFLPLPTRVRDENDVGDVRLQRAGGSNEEDARDPDLVPHTLAVEVSQASVGLALRFNTAVGGQGPVWIQERRFYTVLSSDTATTNCPDTYAIVASAYEVVKAAYRAAERAETLPKPEKKANAFASLREDMRLDYENWNRRYGAGRKSQRRTQRVTI